MDIDDITVAMDFDGRDSFKITEQVSSNVFGILYFWYKNSNSFVKEYYVDDLTVYKYWRLELISIGYQNICT